MVAAMAVELFIYLYAGAFTISAVIAIVLLVKAARRLKKLEDQETLREESRRADEI